MRNGVNRGVVRSSKTKFFETLCLISLALICVFAEFRSVLVIADDVFDVSNVPFERSPKAAISCGAAAERQLRSCKRKQT